MAHGTGRARGTVAAAPLTPCHTAAMHVALRRKYLRRSDATVIAVQLDLDTEGFTHLKWARTLIATPRESAWVLWNQSLDRERPRMAVRGGRPMSREVYELFKCLRAIPSPSDARSFEGGGTHEAFEFG